MISEINPSSFIPERLSPIKTVSSTAHKGILQLSPPVPAIINPSNGSYTIPGGLIVLMVTDMDMEDGSLPDSNLVWSSDRQGELGVGPSVALNTLESGTHIITLIATDSYGISVMAHVQINIAYPLFTPLVGRK